MKRISYDQFVNIVLDETIEVTHDGSQKDIGQVVIRGSSIMSIESLERIK